MSDQTDRSVRIGCILMASGLSRRYGRDKLLEMLGGREVILHTAMSLRGAGLFPVAVTRSRRASAVLEAAGFTVVLHDGEKKSDTIHEGLKALGSGWQGYLFMPGDQPLVRSETLVRMTEAFAACPDRPLRLGFGEAAGSPVIFPAALRDDLMAYRGDSGGMEVLKQKNISCALVQAGAPWELWDVDTPEKMEKVRGKMLELQLV